MIRRIFLIAALIAVVVGVVAVFGGTLPEGNPLRDATQSMRNFGRAVADSFGGGYTMTTP
ncbi:MAG: hypothetical protein HKN91_03700 [Acidimicrobiia bacterium]|nr:hypothetical protein [Acidimicrobiia bacterium]